MYLLLFLNKKTWAKLVTTLLFTAYYSTLYAQSNKNYTSVYAKEFQRVYKNEFNKTLISLSVNKPPKRWNNYKGGPINTIDSSFYFNGNYLSISFPTNSDKIRNEYLAFYFSKKSAICPTLFSLLKYYENYLLLHLSARKLPKELKLIPVVCSAFNPNSSNSIGGSGYWHLNYPQAIKYGLKINRFIDERKDLNKSTVAAASFLSDLYAMYHDWELTLTAYSSGVVTVNKLLKRHSATTYKEIYHFLPEETKDFVQAFVAMNFIENYDNYGIVNLTPDLASDTILIEHKIRFEAINHVIGTNTKHLKFLNPTVLGETFPHNFMAYFPKGTKDNFIQYKDSIYFYQDSIMTKPKIKETIFVIPKDGEPTIYNVRSGDVLGIIAERFNVRVSQIQDWNGLRGTRIDIGQELTIYEKKGSDLVKKKKRLNVKKEKKEAKLSQNTTGIQTTYTVKSGDNLWIIAKKFSGISAQNIMDFNGIDDNLTVGQVLKIPEK